MPFCRNCGAPIEDINSECARCSGQAGQYYQPVPMGQPPVSRPEDDVVKALGLVALIIVIIVVVVIVLAAVLYIMVIDISGPNVQTPAGSWSEVSAESNTSARLTFGFFTTDMDPDELVIYISENGTNAGNLVWGDDYYDTPNNMIWSAGPQGTTAQYFDYNPAGERINSGDYITLEGLAPGTTYTIDVFYIPTDSTVSMTGASSSFITPT